MPVSALHEICRDFPGFGFKLWIYRNSPTLELKIFTNNRNIRNG